MTLSVTKLVCKRPLTRAWSRHNSAEMRLRCRRHAIWSRRQTGLCCCVCYVVLVLLGLQWYLHGWLLHFTGMTRGDEVEERIPLETQGKLNKFKPVVVRHTRPSSIPSTSLPPSPSSESIQPSCSKPSVPVLFYVRIPKSASTSFVNLLMDVSKVAGFELLFNPTGAYSWKEHEIKEVVSQCLQKLQNFKKVVYARHFYFLDFTPFGLTNFTYATIIREPVSRVLSSYLYYHYSPKQHIQRMLDPSHRNETLLACVQYQHEGCTWNLVTKYFCGHTWWCSLGDAKALTTAKQNMKRYFAVVGIMENMALTVQVIKNVLPQFFGNISPELVPSQNINRRSMELSKEERNIVLKVNAADVELYSYAVELLHEKAIACGAKVDRKYAHTS